MTNRLAILATLLLTLVASTSPARADGVDDGFAALHTGDYTAAAAAWQEMVTFGDPAAVNNLAFMYVTGNGVQRDLAKGVQLLTAAANAGFAISQYNLAVVYCTQADTGLTPAEAQVRSTGLYYIAALGGHVRAQYQLAVRTYLGTGTDKDPAKALAWLAIARDRAEADLKPQVDKLIGILINKLTPEQMQVAKTFAAQIEPTLPKTKPDGTPANVQMPTTQMVRR